ncbi:MAG: hypothetical protein O3A00_05825 [Planctomycetota bacterium]|nr:hypothetical protein [Planctomycetota bacterium]
MVTPRVFSYPRYKNHEPDDYFANNRASPTFTRKSHDRWAAKHVRALQQIHDILPPTHWLTIKFNRPEPVFIIKKFLATLTRAVGYFNKTKGQHLALFGVMEPEKGCTVHLHVLVRTTLNNPVIFLSNKIDAFNRKHGTTISIPYCEVPDEIDAVTCYPFKLGSKDKLLFESRNGLRYTYQCGKYFLGKSKLKYERERRKHWIVSKYEAEADAILCNFEDFVSKRSDPDPEGAPSSLERPRFCVVLSRDNSLRPTNECRRRKLLPKIRSPCAWP